MKKANSLYEMFKLLHGTERKMEYVIKVLNISETAFHKNIAKFKNAGFKVTYRNSTYRIDVFKNIFNLDEKDKQIIAQLLESSTKLSKQKHKDFLNFIKKFLLLTQEKDYNDVIKKYEFLKKIALYSKFEEKIKIIKQNFKKRMCLILNSNVEIYATFLRLDANEDKIYLYYENNQTLKEEKISIEKIARITKNKNHLLEIEKSEVVFEIYDRLAKTYLLKEDERIIDSSNNKLTILSSSKDKNELFKRLLRYDTLCKVLYPKSDVVKFREMICKSLENIEIKSGN